MAGTMKIGGKYNWIGPPERLAYLGDNFSGNGRWHQFAKIESPGVVWCEVKGCDLPLFEETAPDDLDRPCGAICAGKVRDGLECATGRCAVRKTPTGFVATCQCGLEVGSLDLARSDRTDVARLLGQWLTNGCVVTPRFTGTWSASIEMCKCGKPPNAKLTGRPASGSPVE